MPKNNVGEFVKRGLVGDCGEGIYGNFAFSRKALNVAVDFVKRCAGDI